jgi:hypothetical protein
VFFSSRNEQQAINPRCCRSRSILCDHPGLPVSGFANRCRNSGNYGTELWEAAHAGAEAAGGETGLHIYWNAPTREDDVERQIALMEKAIENQDAGLVLAPAQYLALVGPVREALSAHVPTVVIRSPLPIPSGQGLS